MATLRSRSPAGPEAPPTVTLAMVLSHSPHAAAAWSPAERQTVLALRTVIDTASIGTKHDVRVGLGIEGRHASRWHAAREAWAARLLAGDKRINWEPAPEGED